MSNLVDKYGCRKMTMLGGLVGCLGFVLSSVANSVEMLFFTFGIIASLGLGFCYVTAVVSIAFWFDKKRTFATGIGASGTGIGTFLFAPLTQWLIDHGYGWRGTTLILAGVLLNFCVCGALMRDPDWLIEENKLEARAQSITTFSNASSVCLDEVKKLLESGAAKEDVLDTLVTNYNTEVNQQILVPEMGGVKKYQSEMMLPTYLKNEEFVLRDGVRSSSRRSLRPDKLKSPEDTSHDEFVTSPLLTNRTELSETKENTPKSGKDTLTVPKLASIETLSPSEKASTNFDGELISLNLSIDDNPHDFNNSDINVFRGGAHGSRLSLNESLISKPTALDSIREELRRSFRGNSLDVVYENEYYHPNHNHNESKINSTPLNSLKNEITIQIPNGIAKLRNKTANKKHASALANGNLHRNTSIRYSNYFKNIRVHRNSIHYRGALLNTHRYRLRASSCPNIYRNSMTTIAKEEEEVNQYF